MFRTLTSRYATRLVVSLFVLALLTSTTLAGSKLIDADVGGTVPVGKGVILRIPAGALSADAWIEAEYEEDEETLLFEFTIDGASEIFNTPVSLKIPASIANRVDSDVLYSDMGEVITPSSSNTYELPHFSRYYFERR